MSLFLADIDATCASLGYYDGNKYYAENDAVQGLKHIIWVLKRDQNEHEFRRYIGHKKIVQSDLLPMIIDYCDDENLGDVLLRLLVNLTNPALLLYKESLPKDGPGRRNYLDLVEILQDYKEAFISTKVWAVLAQKLQKNLEIDIAIRSEEQGLILERILVLIRNVLQVPTNPENEKRADNDASVHDQVLWTLHESGILDLILFILSSEYELNYHLHALEIVSLVYREQKADLLANALLQRSLAEKQEDEQKLITARKREQQIVKPPPARHSRFGGTYVARNMKSVSERDLICHQALEKVVKWDFSREKTKQKRNFRIARENEKVDRQSVFSVRLFLREFCIEILTSAYNNLVKQVRRTLERNALAGHDDSYLMWAIRFFMEFNRLNGFQLHFVSESLSASCIHWICTRIQYNADQINIDKRNRDLWNRRVQLGVQVYREILFSMQVLQQMEDESCRDLFDVLQNNIFYVVEYREIMLQLLLNFNENVNTKSHLRDVIDTANIFLKMMQKFCQGKVVVQKRTKKMKKRKPKKEKPTKLTDDEKKDKTENSWQEIVDSLSVVLSNEINIPEEEHPLPFDAASDKSIDLQRGDCLKRIYKMLRDGNYEQAVLLLRAAREVWPDDDSFGKSTATPEEDLMFFKQIYIYISDSGLVSGDDASDNQDPSDNEGYSSNEEDDENRVTIEEVNFSFEDFARRLLNPKIVRACTIVLKDWEKMTNREIKSTVTILHRIAFEHRLVAMLFQAQLFRVFQQVFHAPKDPRYDELRRLGQYVIRQFVKMVPSNPKIFAELLFFHSARDAQSIEFGYTHEYEEPMRGAWSEEQEEELRRLFMENQENPQTDQDVIDWILDNLIDKTRTRRGVIKKLKELGLIFKAPTKKSTAATANKKLFKPEEDQQLRELYDQFRLDPYALRRIMEMLTVKRRKSKVIERMVQLGLIADASEILPVKKSRKKTSNIEEGMENHSDQGNDSGSDRNESESETDDDDNNRSLSASASRPIPSIKKVNVASSKTIKKRKAIVSKVDLRAINLLRNEIEESHKDALDWIIESLNEAAEDFEEPSDDPDDGIPVVPILDYQSDALQNEQFKKLMLAVGIQAPEKTETYWRIPANLTPSELQYRVQLLNKETTELNENEDDNNYDSNDKRVLGSDEEDVSEEMFNAWRKKSNEENHNLIYNESDDEETNKKGNDNENDDKHSSVEHNKENLKGDTNEMDELNKSSITTKSRIKRKTIDSSDEEEEASTSINKINLSNLPNIHNGNEIDDVETDLNEKNNRSSKRERSSSSDNDEDANKDVKINQKQKKRIRRIVNSSDDDD